MTAEHEEASRASPGVSYCTPFAPGPCHAACVGTRQLSPHPGAPAFDAQAFLDSTGVSRKVVRYKRGDAIFSQGEVCRHVMYIQTGGVKLSVLSKGGREAVVGMLGPGDFFGEGCLAGQRYRMGSSSAITASTILLVR
jgi:CRP/FNR family cyclic AMP-dependent transcriptional regulator